MPTKEELKTLRMLQSFGGKQGYLSDPEYADFEMDQGTRDAFNKGMLSTHPITPYAPGKIPFSPGQFSDELTPEKAASVAEKESRRIAGEEFDLTGPDIMGPPPKKTKPSQQKILPESSLPKKFKKTENPELATGLEKPPSVMGKGKSSKIQDLPKTSGASTNVPTTVPSVMGDEFGFAKSIPPLNSYQITQPSNLYESPVVQEYLPNKTISAVPETPEPGMSSNEFRAKLYDFLKNRIAQRSASDLTMQDTMNKAADTNAFNQFAALLQDSASKMGTLAGKRSEVANFQPLIKSIYERDVAPVQNELAMRERTDQDIMRQASIIDKLDDNDLKRAALRAKLAQKSSSKLLPYYKPATEKEPGALMFQEEGSVRQVPLPPGFEPSRNEWSMLPMFQDMSGKPVFIERNPITGETRKLDLPDNLQALDQLKQQTQSRLAQLKLDMQIASEAQKNELRREEARLSARMGEIKEKEYKLRVRAQEERERANAENERRKREQGKLTESGGKKLSPSELAKYGEGRDMGGLLSNFRNSFNKYRDVIGPVIGRVGGVNPYDVNVQKFQADLRRTAQTIGKFMEGGVLRKEDEAKYEKMLPSLTDIPEVAKYKLNQVEQMVRDRHNASLQALRAQGYDTSGLEMQPSSNLQQKTRKKIVDKFHDKKANKTKYVYDDGSEEVVDGIR